MFKFLILIAAFAFGQSHASRYCYTKVVNQCNTQIPSIACNAKYGNFDCMEDLWNDLFKNLLMRSNEYLLLATNFDNYEFARPGFANLYMDLSDGKWESGIRVMRYIARRNGQVKFGAANGYTTNNHAIHEAEALALAADIEKELLLDTNAIHAIATGPPDTHDLDVAHYVQYKFAFQQSGLLRQIVGYLTELTKMSDSGNYAVGLHEFDDFLMGETVLD